MSFRSCSTPEPLGPGRYGVTFDDTWLQGPGVYGGLTAAAMYRAAQREVPDGLRLRSMSLQYLLPVAPGSATLEVDVDRTGSGSAFLVVRLRQGGAVAVHALSTFGRARTTDLDEDLVARPAAPPPDRVPAMPYVAGMMPVFTQHVEFRITDGVPFSGGPTARIATWLRFREPASDPGIAEMLGLLDAPPPAILARTAGFRPSSTVSFHVHLLREPPAPGGDGFWFSDLTSRVTSEGWSDEQIELFGPDGRAVAIGRQLVAVLR